MATSSAKVVQLLFMRRGSESEPQEGTYVFSMYEAHGEGVVLSSYHWRDGRVYVIDGMGHWMKSIESLHDFLSADLHLSKQNPPEQHGKLHPLFNMPDAHADPRQRERMAEDGSAAWSYNLTWDDGTTSGPGVALDELLEVLRTAAEAFCVEEERKRELDNAIRQRELEYSASFVSRQLRMQKAGVGMGLGEYSLPKFEYDDKGNSQEPPSLVGVYMLDDRPREKYEYRLILQSVTEHFRTAGVTYLTASAFTPSGHVSLSEVEVPLALLGEISQLLPSAEHLGTSTLATAQSNRSLFAGTNFAPSYEPRWAFGLLWSDGSETGLGEAKEQVRKYLRNVALHIAASSDISHTADPTPAEHSAIWSCACGCKQNVGKYCPECGARSPSASQTTSEPQHGMWRNAYHVAEKLISDWPYSFLGNPGYVQDFSVEPMFSDDFIEGTVPTLVGILVDGHRGYNTYTFQVRTFDDSLLQDTGGKTYVSAVLRLNNVRNQLISEEIPAGVMNDIAIMVRSAGNMEPVVWPEYRVLPPYLPGLHVDMPPQSTSVHALVWSDGSVTGAGKAKDEIVDYLLALAEHIIQEKEQSEALHPIPSIEEWICPNCGFQVSASRFCVECGAQKPE